MKRLMCVLVVSGFVAGAALVKQPTVRAGSADACGEQGQPACPMQAWMEKYADPPIDNKDLKALEIVFERSAKLVPDPKWNEGENGWAKIAQEGAAAARSGDFAQAKKQCKSCHKAWREKYREEFRTKPIREEASTKPSPKEEVLTKPAPPAAQPAQAEPSTKKLSKHKASTKKPSKQKATKKLNKHKASTKKPSKQKASTKPSEE